MTGDTAADGEAAVQRALLLMRVGRLAEAMNLLDRAAGAEPDDATIHMFRSACLLDLGRPADALEAATRACALEPEYGRAHLMRCRALRRLDAPATEMLAAAHLAVRYEPEDVSPWEELVTAYVLSGQFPQAESALADMRSRFPTETETEVAAALVEVQRPAGVDGLIRVMASPIGRIILVLFVLSGGGIALYLVVTGLDRWRRHRAASRAKEAIERALAAEPDSYRLQWMLAHFYEEQGRYLAALDLQVRLGASEPRPELVERVLTTTRRGLWMILVPIVTVVGLVVVGVGGVMADDVLPVPIGLVIMAVVGVLGFVGARRARDWWLGRLPPGVAAQVALFRRRN